MRSYKIVEMAELTMIGSLRRSYKLHLYEGGIEEPRAPVFESRDRAYEAAMHYVTEYDGYLPFDDE
jgi:hypothetical protein